MSKSNYQYNLEKEYLKNSRKNRLDNISKMIFGEKIDEIDEEFPQNKSYYYPSTIIPTMYDTADNITDIDTNELNKGFPLKI